MKNILKNILTVARKEWQFQLNNPAAYIVVGSFMLLWEFLFFRNIFLIGEASLRTLFDLLPWIFLVVVPALTMGSLAEEKSEGTLEFLLTRPIRIHELILGKFFGIFGVFCVTLFFIFPLAWSLGKFGHLDWGEVAAQYLAAVMLSSLFASLGIFVSSIFLSQVSAFVTSSIVGFFLLVSGTEMVTSRLPLSVAPFLDQLSAASHFDSLARGAVDVRDLWYFLSFVAIFLSGAAVVLLKGKYGEKKKVLRQFRLVSFLAVGIVVLSNIVGSRIPGRFDFTEEKRYTLSPATISLLGSLPDDVTSITLYASGKLPTQLQPTLREAEDVLRDYAATSGGKIHFFVKDPSLGGDIADEAESLGIQSVRFNVVSQEEFQVKEGYLGVVVSSGGKHKSIPFLQNTGSLEYQISGFLQELTTDKKPKIGFITGHGEKSLSQDYRTVFAEWGKQFDIQEISAESDDGKNLSVPPGKPSSQKLGQNNAGVPEEKHFSIPDDIDTLIIAGPNAVYSASERKTLSEFLNRGGNAFFLLDGVTVSSQAMAASQNKNSLSDFVRDQTGVDVREDLVFDLRSNESVSFGGGRMQYILPYPLWVRAVREQTTSPIVAKIQSLTLPWPSSIEFDDKAVGEKGFRIEPLFTTTENGGSIEDDLSIVPDQKWPRDSLGKKLLAVALSQESKNGKSRIVVVGNSGFLSEQFMQNSPENLAFALESLSWLSQESSLGSILIKNAPSRKFLFSSSADPDLLKFGNMGFVFLVVAGYGSFRLYRRRQQRRKAYPGRGEF